MADKPNYTLGHGNRLVAAFGLRNTDREARFILPYLRPGMTLLDRGCGPGTITVGLAEQVAPGQVTGIDISGAQFEIGRKLAAERRVSNITFRQGNVADLAFADSSLDVVFAHGMLCHLSDPQAALTEMHRVLRDDGLLGLRDADEGGSLLAPPNPMAERFLSAVNEAWRLNGTDPFFGRRHGGLLRAAGFEPLHFSASYDNYSTTAETRGLAKFAAALLRQPHMSGPLLESGWTTPQELHEMCTAFEEWGSLSDAFFGRARFETVARKSR